MKRISAILALVCALLLALAALLARPVQRGFWPDETLSTRDNGEALVRQTQAASFLGGVHRSERTYEHERGTVVVGRMTAGERASEYHMVRTDTLTCQSGTIWYYDPDTADWKTTPLAQMQLGTSCVYIDGDTEDYFCYLPAGYQMLENNSLLATGSLGYLDIAPSGSGWRMRLFGSCLEPGEFCDYTIVTAAGEPSLLDVDGDNVMHLWSTYCNAGDGRWCYDGYYFPTPDTYIPYGPNIRYRCVAAYLVKSMEHQSKASRCADLLSSAMLDTLSLQQNEEGYFPSMSGSTWLAEDYGIAPGYYDTRFNSDLMEVFGKHIVRTGSFTEPADRYFDFFLQHADRCHDETENGGWLVWDYAPAQKPVHSSLNHQLSEILQLYTFSELLRRPALAELADRMLLGIEDTCGEWIMDDRNLHYCHMPDGSFGKDDYPYLTYNDLYNLQQKLESLGKGRSPSLDTLMEAKLSWMQANGVTGYQE